MQFFVNVMLLYNIQLIDYIVIQLIRAIQLNIFTAMYNVSMNIVMNKTSELSIVYLG